MAPKGKTSGVSATSFLDLKSELARQAEDFSKKKAARGTKYAVGDAKGHNKKGTVWERANKGVNDRARRDVEQEVVSRSTVEATRTVLLRKAALYEKLRKGKSGGLSEAQYDALLVDFDAKADSADSDDEDEEENGEAPGKDGSSAMPRDDDPIVEYEDEFGRIRTAPKSEVPRHLLPKPDEQNVGDDDVIYNPTHFFPVYEPSTERVQAVAAELAEAQTLPADTHYDAEREVRARGAAFYQFAADEEARKQQMTDLREAREETKRAREETGAVDVLPGEVEGMRADDGGGPGGSRAMQKRRKDIEERRALLEAKRKKRRVDEGSTAPRSQSPGLAASADKTLDADSFLAQLEQEVLAKHK